MMDQTAIAVARVDVKDCRGGTADMLLGGS
jgi:hypothetical protein